MIRKVPNFQTDAEAENSLIRTCRTSIFRSSSLSGSNLRKNQRS